MIGEHHSYRLDPVIRKGFPIIGLIQLVVTMPICYLVAVPIMAMDVLATFYMWTCFPIYGIKRVSRSRYVNMQRRDLSSLNIVDRFNCHYCSYTHGVLRYVQQIAIETERMWCPIRHKSKKNFSELAHQSEFAESGDKPTLETYYLKYEIGLTRQGPKHVCEECSE